MPAYVSCHCQCQGKEHRLIFVRWHRAAVVFSVQSWLGESEETKKSTSTPGYFSVGMSRTISVITLEADSYTLTCIASDVPDRYVPADLPAPATQPAARQRDRSCCPDSTIDRGQRMQRRVPMRWEARER